MLKSFKKIFFLLLTFSIIIILTTFYDSVLKDYNKKLDNFAFEYIFDLFNNDIEVSLDDEYIPIEFKNLTYCEKSSEWSDVNGELFIRRNTAKYFIDLKSLLLFTMCRTSWIKNFKFIFFVRILFKNELVSYRKLKKIETNNFISENGYEVYSMSVSFDWKKYIIFR